MSLSVGAATDRLVVLAQQSTSGVTVNGEPMVAWDGWPTSLDFGMFIIGLSQPPGDLNEPDPAITQAQHWAGLGQMRVDEDYLIPCCIDARGLCTQKEARDIAISVFDTFGGLFVADLTLAGALKSPGMAEVQGITHNQLPVGTASERAYRHLISFGVHCTNRTTY